MTQLVVVLIGSKLVRYSFSLQRHSQVGISDIQVAGSGINVEPHDSSVQGRPSVALAEEEEEEEESDEESICQVKECIGGRGKRAASNPGGRGLTPSPTNDDIDMDMGATKENDNRQRERAPASNFGSWSPPSPDDTPMNVVGTGLTPSPTNVDVDVDMDMGAAKENDNRQSERAPASNSGSRSPPPPYDTPMNVVGTGTANENNNQGKATTPSPGNESPPPSDNDVNMDADSAKEDKGTPESSPEMFPPSPDKDDVHSKGIRKNPKREAAKGRMNELPPQPKPKPKPKPKPMPQPEFKSHAKNVARSYFEEIEFGGSSRFVEVIDLLQDMVSHLYLLLTWI